MLPFNPNPRSAFIVGDQHIREMQAAADMASLAQEASGGASPSILQGLAERLAALEQEVAIRLEETAIRLLINLFPESEETQPDDLTHTPIDLHPLVEGVGQLAGDGLRLDGLHLQHATEPERQGA